MTANLYEEPKITVIEFSLEDVLTKSSTVTTTTPPTTLPATTEGGVHIGGGSGSGYIEVPYSDFFK